MIALLLALACGQTGPGETDASTVECTESLASTCAGGCPATVEEAADSCGSASITASQDEPSCDGLDVVLCTGRNTTAYLWMFAGGELVAVGQGYCPPPSGYGTADCEDQGGWHLSGDDTPDVAACLAGTPSGLECFE